VLVFTRGEPGVGDEVLAAVLAFTITVGEPGAGGEALVSGTDNGTGASTSSDTPSPSGEGERKRFRMVAIDASQIPYPSSQLRLSTSGMRGTSMTTGLQLVSPRLTTPNCEQSRTEFIKHTMLVWRMYNRYMSSLTLQTRSASPWTRLTIQDNMHPFPFVRC
jgi:hypothetical protein